ncbi:glutathione S-transferase [Photobacterium kishitanii]|uniref:glutathione transferase n=1 Tax=Photobacterium kishitanii TaxID=318456 RepID=A0AAX0YX57_9GAMM|nr:glutathione S-transferase [Photobacterium kishitanii]KJG10208.1 glutathione S-transferase [Photobacterium kishitanii]KJG59416.1 glutathione S-transferase [Photobacterium kishitanii]KJG62407.1 glutathione S-transferase [Photobacterium kishitanii]KJG67562.1 glutathione S-transferase [Photobacterium kishitanii]KJG70234.1 glutathione S-transferase [Photobacterium kishitanii]
MITLHHLNKSRSKRIIWLLEELGLEYEVKPYLRDSVTFLAPPELKAIHPLGKSPVIEDNGLVIAESGAITEYLIQTYGANLAPKLGTPAYIEYLQWLHFAESSAILPLLLKMFVAKDGAKTNFLEGYADVEAEKVIGYFEQRLEGKTYLVEERLTGADIMMSFIAEILQNNGMISHYPNIQRYQAQLATHDKFVTAEQVEHQFG